MLAAQQTVPGVDRVYTVSEIREMLDTNPKAVTRAIKAIYAYQTQSEKSTGATIEHNNVGFNGVDSEILSSFAQQLNRGRSLSAKQFEIAKKKIYKYARQLTKIANGEM